MSPASTRPLPLRSVGVPALLTRASEAAFDVGVVVVALGEVTARPAGSVAVAFAVLVTAPASTSLWRMA